MGQYHITVNLDKRQFIHPHKLGDGLKLVEQMGSSDGTAAALLLLLACSNGRGGGDFDTGNVDPEDAKLIGSWAGDRIAVVGDYAEGEYADLYAECHDKYEDVSDAIVRLFEANGEVGLVGTGWRTRIDLFHIGMPGFEMTCAGLKGRVARIDGKRYPCPAVLAALKEHYRPHEKSQDWAAIKAALAGKEV